MNDERESKPLGNLEKETLTSVLITEADSSKIVLGQKNKENVKIVVHSHQLIQF